MDRLETASLASWSPLGPNAFQCGNTAWMRSRESSSATTRSSEMRTRRLAEGLTEAPLRALLSVVANLHLPVTQIPEVRVSHPCTQHSNVNPQMQWLHPSPERRLVPAGADDLSPCAFPNNRKYLPEVAPHDDDFAIPWEIITHDIPGTALDGFMTMPVGHGWLMANTTPVLRRSWARELYLLTKQEALALMMWIMNKVGRLGAGKEGGRDTAGGNGKGDSPAGTKQRQGRRCKGRSCMQPLVRRRRRSPVSPDPPAKRVVAHRTSRGGRRRYSWYRRRQRFAQL